MKKLLEPQDLRKIETLYFLSLNLKPQNINELASKLNISTKTLLSTIDEINHDAVLFNQEIKIERHLRTELELKVSNKFSLFYFKLKYLKESLLYQILDSIFNASYTTMHAIAEENHLSSTSLYRKLSKLKTILGTFNLALDALHDFPIKGSEKQLRFFYFKFYCYSAQIFEWPFTDELRELCLMFYHNVFTDHFEAETTLMKEKIILWLAINFIRVQDGFQLSEDDICEMQSSISHTNDFLIFKEKFEQTFSQLSDTDHIVFNESDYILIFTLLICDEEYFIDMDIVYLTLIGKERTLYEEATLHFLKTLVQHLKRPLSNEEYHNIYRNLLKINMHAYYFTEKDVFFTINHRFDILKETHSEYKNAFKEFYNNLYIDDDKFEFLKSNPNLYYRYMLLLVNNLDIHTFHPTINIKFSLTAPSYIESFYRTKLQSLTLSPLNFIPEHATAEADIIVSHTMLNIDDTHKYFIVNTPPTPWDWERLESELNRIQKSKRTEAYIIA